MKSSLSVGKDLQDVLLINLESTPPVPVDLTVSVVAPNVAIISDSRTAMGSATVTFHDVSDTTRRRVYVQGLAVGDTELRAQAIGFNDAVTEVAVDPAALYIAWPYNNFEADAADASYEVTVFTAPLDRTTLEYGGNIGLDESSCWWSPNCLTLEEQAPHPEIRGGLTVQVPIQSSNPSVGVLAAGSLTFVGGQDYSQTVELDLVGSGEMELSIIPPTGFSMPADRDTRIQGIVRGIGSSPSLETYIGRVYSYDVDASHPAQDYFFLLTTAPTGMTIDETTGMIQWISEESQLGDHTVTVELHDDSGLVDTQSFTLSVLEVDPNNRAPMIVSGPIDHATEGIPYTYRVKAIDYDEGEVLTFSLTTAPDGMSIDSVTGVVEWTPGVGEAGDYVVVLNVQDVAGATATQRYLLTVSTIEDLDQDFDGFTVNDGDCNDADPFVNPGAVDIAGNGVDEDCDGEDALISILLKAGSETIRIPVGTSTYVGYTFDFKTVAAGDYNFAIDEQVLPDTEGITIESGLPAAITATGSKWSNMGQQISGNTVGTYELVAIATLQDTGVTAQALVVIEVTAGEDIPVLKQVGSDPDAIPIAQEQEVIFTTFLVGTQREPDEVVLEQIDADGSPIAVFGELVDDGSDGDLAAGDLVYSGTFSLFSETEGNLHFQARAVFDGGAETYMADECIVGVTRFPIDVEPSTGGTVVTHPENGRPMASNQVLVSFIAGTTSETIESIVTAVDGTVTGTLYRLGFYLIEVPDTGDATGVLSAVDTLLTFSEVEVAETVSVGNTSASPIVVPNDTYFDSYQYDENTYKSEPIYLVRADEAWLISKGGESIGSGPVIAIIDSGVDLEHPDLRNKLTSRRGNNYCVPRNSSRRRIPRDDFGHGTFVAGIAAAETDNNMGIAGISWNSPIMAYKIISSANHYYCVFSAAAIRSAIGRGVKIINMSYRSDDRTIAEQRAVALAQERGAVLIAAAGNDRDIVPKYPAAFNEVIAVGAIAPQFDAHFNVTSYARADVSNHGNWVNMASPAPKFSTIPLDKFAYEINTDNTVCPDATKTERGCYGNSPENKIWTSFATPMVSGAAALIWADRPWLDNITLRSLLERTAVPMPGEGLGAGRLDVFEALFNGSFEMDWRAGWIANSQIGIPPSMPSDHAVVNTINSVNLETGVAGYNPMEHPVRGEGEANENMVYIGNDGGAVTETTLSKTFTLQPGVTEIPLSFDYYFLSEEAPEYLRSGGCGRCTCNLFTDLFLIEVTSQSGETNYIYHRVTTDFDDLVDPDWEYRSLDILNIGADGGDVRPYDLGEYLFGTPLTNVCPITENQQIGVVGKRVRNELIPLTGGPGRYRISITVLDVADAFGDSAIVIDNIRFRPE